ncbi:hypothetical protein DZF91_01480 [Actinomadura logoneensis]|uniref:Uncharacterized protein n=1 Tax=Actinomadura logoneensis TaxID=2293572 RepID=A0A372JTQ4_9ACTN|nr:hypothetical protein [Actinomadura logoneensis]RFU43387.1 hypothetical protein DZF91_01480 [Actinomadura logoneensis]
MSTLEDRYRRLLAWYPADHRAAHEREMLDLLLSTARPGQTRPTPAEIADLLAGAIRIRLRPARSGDGPSAWPAALALTGFLALLQLLADGAQYVIDMSYIALSQDGAERKAVLLEPVVHFGIAYWLAWAAIAVLAWRGRRDLAARAACAVTGVRIILAVHETFSGTGALGSLSGSMARAPLGVALLATASLIASPGPLYGARLAGRARVVIAAVSAAVLAAVLSFPGSDLLIRYLSPGGDDDTVPLSFTHYFIALDRLRLAGMSVAALMVVAALARSREGRRACALLAIAAVPALGVPATSFFPALLDGLANPHGGIEPTRAIAYGLVGFVLAMLCVRLVELPGRARTRPREQSPG